MCWRSALDTAPNPDFAESEIRGELQRILASRSFAGSPRICRFLTYIVEKTLAGETDALKEAIIGREVFDRANDYDPKTEPIVRTEARRLRLKLEELYGGTPGDFRVRISIPRGRYVASFEEAGNAPQAEEDAVAPAETVPAEEPAVPPGPSKAPPEKRTRNRLWPVLLSAAAAALAVTVIFLLARHTTPLTAGSAVLHYAITLPAGRELRQALGKSVAISPDGAWLAYVAREGGVYRLYLHRLDGAETRVIPQTESATSPEFAPDGKSVAFYQGDKLRRCGLDGRCSDLTGIVNQFVLPGLAWDQRGGLFFNNAPNGNEDKAPSVIFRIPSPDSARVEQTTRVDMRAFGAEAMMVQQVLPGGWPDGGRLLVSMRAPPPHERVVAVASRDGTLKPVLDNAMGGLYLPTGQLVAYRDGNLIAAPFDLNREEVTGQPVPVLRGVGMDSWQGPDMAVAGNGTLVYAQGVSGIPDRTLLWVDRAGNEKPLPIPPGPFNPLDLSPDGSRLLMARFDQVDSTWSLWSYGLRDGVSEKLAGPSPDVIVGCWSGDGTRVMFGSKQNDRGMGEILEIPSRGGETAHLASQQFYGHFPQTSSKDGNWVAYTLGTLPRTKSDIWLLDLRQRAHPVAAALVATTGWDSNPVISPDGRSIAYDSTVSGTREVYFQPLVNGAPPVQISHNGGAGPLWAPDGRKIFYREGARMMEVSVKPAPGNPVELFRGDYLQPDSWQRFALLSPDGERFLMVREDSSARKRYIQVVANWFSEVVAKTGIPAQ